MKNYKGITLISLVITIIVMIILSGVGITQGNKLIKQAKIESIITTMITIRSKAKVYAEEVNSQVWDLKDDINAKQNRKKEIFLESFNMQETTLTKEAEGELNQEIKENGGYESYELSQDTIEKIGLKDAVAETDFVVVYNNNDYTKLDVIKKSGINYKGKKYYTLSKLQQAIKE